MAKKERPPSPVDERKMATVETICSVLERKGKEVWQISPTATVFEAIAEMADRGVGALLVVSQGQLVGIISERDLVHAIAKGGAAALTDPVGSHMTPNPETCTETDTVETVMEVMTQGRFRHVPVLDDSMRLCGMISIFAASSARMPSCCRSASIMAIAGWVLPQQGNCLRPMVLPVTSSGSAQWSKILSAS